MTSSGFLSASLGRAAVDAELADCVDRDVCGACGECRRACPQRLALPEIMRCATYYQSEFAADAREYYRAIAPGQTAQACRDCGVCERVCPRGLLVREHIRRVSQLWGAA